MLFEVCNQPPMHRNAVVVLSFILNILSQSSSISGCPTTPMAASHRPSTAACRVANDRINICRSMRQPAKLIGMHKALGATLVW